MILNGVADSHNIMCFLFLQQNLCRSRPQSPSYNPNKVTNSSSASTPPKMVSPIPISSNISGSPNNQSSLRVFRNLSSKQPQTQQILKNNNNNQRSSSRTASSPSSPDTSSPLREPDNIINNSPLDFTSKKVNLFGNVFHAFLVVCSE